MPATGALTVVCSRLSSACLTAPAPAARAPRPRPPAPCSRRPAAARSAPCAARRAPAARRRAPASSRLSATRIAGFGFDDLRRAPIRRRPRGSAAATAASNCCCAISSFASSPLEPLDVARGPWRRWLPASRCRACAVASRALRRLDRLFGLADAAVAPADAALGRRHVAGRGRRRDRHAARGRHARPLRRRPARRAARVERDLVIARIDLDQHGAGLDLLVVDDRDAQHRAAHARRHRRHVRIDLRIVGRLLPGVAHSYPPIASMRDDDQHRRRRGHVCSSRILQIASRLRSRRSHRASMAFATLKP